MDTIMICLLRGVVVVEVMSIWPKRTLCYYITADTIELVLVQQRHSSA